MPHRCAIVVMTKFPEPGKVKTRLMPNLSAEAAAGVHRAFLRHWIDRLHSFAVGEVFVCFDPPDRLVDFRRLLPAVHPARFFPQVPGDLGTRIADAVRRVHRDFDRIAFVGADSPDVPRLEIGSTDLTLGPTPDGGFFLLATCAGLEVDRLLARIDWSSGRERQQVVERAASLGYTLSLTEPWDDVDHPADLRRLIERLSRSDRPDDRRLLADLSFLRREALP